MIVLSSWQTKVPRQWSQRRISLRTIHASGYGEHRHAVTCRTLSEAQTHKVALVFGPLKLSRGLTVAGCPPLANSRLEDV